MSLFVCSPGRGYSSFGRPQTLQRTKKSESHGRSCRSSHKRAGVRRSWCVDYGGLKTIMIAWLAGMDDTFPSLFWVGKQNCWMILFPSFSFFFRICHIFVFCFFYGCIMLKVNVCHVAHLHFWHLFCSFIDARWPRRRFQAPADAAQIVLTLSLQQRVEFQPHRWIPKESARDQTFQQRN